MFKPLEPKGPEEALAPIVAEPAEPPRVMTFAAERAARGVRGAMATVLERHGSAPSTPGQKLWIGSDRSCVGTVGGGAVEREIMSALAKMAVDKVGLTGWTSMGVFVSLTVLGLVAAVRVFGPIEDIAARRKTVDRDREAPPGRPHIPSKSRVLVSEH